MKFNTKSINGIALLLLILTFLLLEGYYPDVQVQKKGISNTSGSLSRLMDGNSRFSNLQPAHPDADLQHLRQAAKEQHPWAVVVSCSDSRVAPELIFDQGIGDLFVIRNAGNIISGVELGSIEYAVEHLGTKLIVIMGHENCGAVKAFVEGGETHGHIKDIVDSLKMEEEIKAVPLDDVNRLDDCVKANILHAVRQLKIQSSIIREKLEDNSLKIIGARYDLDEFKVDILYPEGSQIPEK